MSSVKECALAALTGGRNVSVSRRRSDLNGAEPVLPKQRQATSAVAATLLLSLLIALSDCQGSRAPLVATLDAGAVAGASDAAQPCASTERELEDLRASIASKRAAFNHCSVCDSCSIAVTLSIAADGRVVDAVAQDLAEAELSESARRCILATAAAFTFPRTSCSSTFRMRREFRPVEPP